ncbi:MAG: bifunctional glutamate N-acetyltransferase/amino-acid acetyltransferase ArgJ [Coriobacteriia bacterium]|nr:bifunctional glutamate N-acetyltransferase/amino-acid acetyltransferase ArgJ [Coriobacteriia bacterium]
MKSTSAHHIQVIKGGLGAVKGLRLAAVSAGFRKNPEKLDLAVIIGPRGSTAAGVFTQSNFAAPPVKLSRRHLDCQAEGKGFRALIINSGKANAATGEQGMKTALEVCQAMAAELKCSPEEILAASTGVIGAQISPGVFSKGLHQALVELSDDTGKNEGAGVAVAEAIMTTDTYPKLAARSFVAKDQDGSETTYTVGGMAKGSGMIAPHMATMIATLATDACIEQAVLDQALKKAVNQSFNKVTIDSDTSTNDCAFLIATGAANRQPLEPGSLAHEAFETALAQVCCELTYEIARDGEGATKVIVVEVTGAASDEDADAVARAVADSPLVKTAIAGHDANWGRIAMAAGKARAAFNQEEVSISIMELEVFTQGSIVEFSEEEASKRFKERDEVFIAIDLGAGQASTRIWTCDLTKEYVAINGDYRT